MSESEHHKQRELCQTRPLYRQGRNLTAVKVYTINDESQHVLIFGVPQIGLRSELETLCTRYGQVDDMKPRPDLETEPFAECYLVTYERIQSARAAKRSLDDTSFYGGVLHVCYAPEYETLEQTRTKLIRRKRDVASKLTKNDGRNSRKSAGSHADPRRPNGRSDAEGIESPSKKTRAETRFASTVAERVVYGPDEGLRRFADADSNDPSKCNTKCKVKRIIFLNKDP